MAHDRRGNDHRRHATGSVVEDSYPPIAMQRGMLFNTLLEPQSSGSVGQAHRHLGRAGMPLPWALLDRLYTDIDKSYRPCRIDSQGLLIRTKASSARANDDTMGWKGLSTRGLETTSIAGDHDGIYREDVPTLARQITDAVDRRSGNPVGTLLCYFVTGLMADGSAEQLGVLGPPTKNPRTLPSSGFFVEDGLAVTYFRVRDCTP